ncbi:adenylate/guanylate cyclase domain-containing protein [Bradyrhizobium sp. AUGA SZCCT0283]|uniref:adenylate/guanylate cyclase domain-containing protein n=1 Tax=Bradyrhizobium sp. AUGA SZCCT0283 TaxID=2807671 RepID=UPI00201315AD|nr:adenylate/guanylate cyclase domain-containing protein [Bradyrhizobium sp. AUGA SZCCT0283]
MSGEHVERRLAAILAADVAGSCRLIGIDEEGTLARLKALRRILFDPNIAEHHGRIVKNTGDGAIAEFASVVDAVRCADEIQRGMAEQNIDVPQDKRIELRIGIHVGDISKKTISLVTGSILQCVSKGSLTPAVSASRMTLAGKFVARLM